jgi:hypothetical protein
MYLPEGKQFNTYSDGFMNTIKTHVDFSQMARQKHEMRGFIAWKTAFSKE